MRGIKRIHRAVTYRAVTLMVLLALALSVTTVVYAETGTVAVTGGSLAVTAANVTLSGVSLTGADLTSTSTSNAWTAKDPTGTGAGWRLTVASTDFTSDDVQEVYTDGVNGTFTLTYGGQTTAAINEDDTAATVETRIEALTTVTAATVTGSGTSSTPWVIRFDSGSGSGIMTSTDTTLASTITLATIDISVTDQQFQITLTTGNVGTTAGNTQPVSDVQTKTNIGDSTVTFLTAVTDTGMGDYTLNPDFELEVRAEVYKATYTVTLTVATVSGP